MRLLGITIPDKKRLDMALTALYGIGRARTHSILTEANVDFSKTASDISAEEENKIKQIVESMKLEADSASQELLDRMIAGGKRSKQIPIEVKQMLKRLYP
jgi:small subunit ribosomal protein S13